MNDILCFPRLPRLLSDVLFYLWKPLVQQVFVFFRLCRPCYCRGENFWPFYLLSINSDFILRYLSISVSGVQKANQRDDKRLNCMCHTHDSCVPKTQSVSHRTRFSTNLTSSSKWKQNCDGGEGAVTSSAVPVNRSYLRLHPLQWLGRIWCLGETNLTMVLYSIT